MDDQHRLPLAESRFLSDIRWTDRPPRWPLYLSIPAIFIGSGVCWAALFVLFVEVSAILKG
jgi:hypothetical protein